MIEMYGPTGAVTVNDVFATVTTILTSVIAWRQRDIALRIEQKDYQIAEQNKQIDWLKQELEYCRALHQEKERS
jgi:cell division protein FtsB